MYSARILHNTRITRLFYILRLKERTVFYLRLLFETLVIYLPSSSSSSPLSTTMPNVPGFFASFADKAQTAINSSPLAGHVPNIGHPRPSSPDAASQPSANQAAAQGAKSLALENISYQFRNLQQQYSYVSLLFKSSIGIDPFQEPQHRYRGLSPLKRACPSISRIFLVIQRLRVKNFTLGVNPKLMISRMVCLPRHISFLTQSISSLRSSRLSQFHTRLPCSLPLCQT